MKKIVLALFSISLLVVSCKDEKTTETKTTEQTAQNGVQYFGEKITEDGAKPVDSVASILGTASQIDCKLQGPIEAVCQKKGCWMELKKADGTTMRVTFKDYGFFMPKDCSGKTAIVDGFAKVDTTSIQDLKEYAKDDNKSQAEIDAITKPEYETVFEAKGVILK